MSLQGSLETFALPDVMVLLASTKKDGELRVSGAATEGRIWVETGQIVHSDVNGRETPSIEAVFELLRLGDGNFVFDADHPAPARHEPEAIDMVLADAQVRLAEWREIAKVVPHLDVMVDMASKAPGDQVTISARQWKLLRAVAGGSSVAGLMDAAELTEFDACRAVKELFEADLVSLDLSAKAKAPAAAPAPAPAASPAPPAEKRSEANGSIHKRPASLNGSGVTAAAAAPTQTEAERIEQVKSEVEKELAALADEAAKGPAKPKVRATTNTPGSVSDDAPGARHPEPKPEEKQALVAQLAALEGENEEKMAKKVEEHLARGGELPEVGEGDEPINRGLLLKFLSSVRN